MGKLNYVFWMVWNEHGQAPTFKHPDVDSAEREARRLVERHGGTFHVLRVVGRVTKCNVVWEWDEDEAPLPF